MTHGAPSPGNQLVTVVRTLLVDWASAALAPRERDLHALVAAGHGDLVATDPDPDVELLELFDLEQRLVREVRPGAISPRGPRWSAR